MESIALVLLAIVGLVLVSVLVLVAVRYARYKATHPWTHDDLRAARQQSVEISRGTLIGNAAQHLAPLLPEIAERFAPSDWRFLGSPIDFVVFDGLHKGAVERIVLVEVKTGSRRLSAEQRQIKEAAGSRLLQVEFEVVRVPMRTDAQFRMDPPGVA